MKRHRGLPNAARHIRRWQIEYPEGNEARLVFQVKIPVSELRSLPPPDDSKKVWWVSAPDNATVHFLFYITRPNERDPAPQAIDNRQPLFSLQLRNARWFVAIADLTSLSLPDLESARAAVREQATSAGVVLSADHRASLFFEQPLALGSNGLIELCLTAA